MTAGAIFVAIGIVAIAMASQWRFGTSAQMGPGYLPVVLGSILIVLGSSILLRAMRGGADGRAAGRPDLWAVATIIGPIFLFAALLPHAGLLLSVSGLVVLTRLTGQRRHLVETAVLSVALSVLVAAIFVLGLGMRLPLLPPSLN